ncbi:cilia- and flagella-associated protein 44 [Rana temporaria]|uniref:cilia- and flagella-associated protein 44 n=1 Tax=Rana temporaria TaxID=8407 RepID=UPI001AAD38CE|nr:cilia- and flagella-associated protein 44 [Rana temporaria]
MAAQEEAAKAVADMDSSEGQAREDESSQRGPDHTDVESDQLQREKADVEILESSKEDLQDEHNPNYSTTEVTDGGDKEGRGAEEAVAKGSAGEDEGSGTMHEPKLADKTEVGVEQTSDNLNVGNKQDTGLGIEEELPGEEGGTEQSAVEGTIGEDQEIQHKEADTGSGIETVEEPLGDEGGSEEPTMGGTIGEDQEIQHTEADTGSGTKTMEEPPEEGGGTEQHVVEGTIGEDQEIQQIQADTGSGIQTVMGDEGGTEQPAMGATIGEDQEIQGNEADAGSGTETMEEPPEEGGGTEQPVVEGTVGEDQEIQRKEADTGSGIKTVEETLGDKGGTDQLTMGGTIGEDQEIQGNEADTGSGTETMEEPPEVGGGTEQPAVEGTIGEDQEIQQTEADTGSGTETMQEPPEEGGGTEQPAVEGTIGEPQETQPDQNLKSSAADGSVVEGMVVDTEKEGVTSGEIAAAEARSDEDQTAETAPQNPDEEAEGQVPESLANEQPKQEEGENEEEEETEEKIPEDFYYDYESICSQPYITPDSGIPSGVLQLLHSFGYDCNKRANLHLLDDQTLLYVAGTVIIILTLKTQEQRYLRSSSGGGIGAVTVHPSRKYFAVAEKGHKPNIILYEFPSLKPFRILRGGTEEAYTFVDFNMSGTLLASVGSSPDYMLTIWDWKQEKIMLRLKAFSQDVFQVTFSPENEEQLTTCGTGHIRFWKMAHTFTGLKLQGELGRFGKTALTDIEGYVELPDGKVISGSEWGNMLLWEGGLIKVEICRRGRRQCHNGPINQFVLDEGELITIGADGYVRVWDFEAVDTADTIDDTGLLEMEPMNELLVGKNVNLRFMVKTKENDSPLWFAQDGCGGIWKLDLSFSNITQDPEQLFSFHAGEINALDASPSTYLMATTSSDRSVRIYDFAGKLPLVEMKFKQGGTSLIWAPRMVNPKGGLFVAGFQDGVIRILEVYNSSEMKLLAGRSGTQDAAISLKHAFKPHEAPVTCLAYERNGEILATGSTDRTVFFFAVGDTYEPIGFIRVPGPVKELHWSPPSHEENTLLVLCENGFAVEIPAPAAEKNNLVSTYEISNLPLRYFRFSSIKSKIEREEQLAQIRKNREQKLKEHQAWVQKQKEQGVELTEEELQEPYDDEEEKLPELYVPKEPSPILCGFYASPGKFWLSMDGYDSGFLYLCEFSKGEDQIDPSTRKDEPLSVLPMENTKTNPIHKIHFSSNKKLLYCGMKDGAVRVYPLQPNDPLLTSIGSYWSLGVHDNQYGRMQAISSSYDDQYLVTCGADGNIFTFSILSMEDIERDLKVKKAKVPSPRTKREGEKHAEDIEDPNAYSIENATQKRQQDLLMKQAEEKKARKRQELAQMRKEFQKLLRKNAELPKHMQMGRAEFEMDHRIREEMERQKSESVRTVLKELAWEQEKHNIGLKKLQAQFRDKVEFDTVMVRAISTEHQVSTYRLLSLTEKHFKMKGMILKRRPTRYDIFQKEEMAKENRDSGAQSVVAVGVVTEPSLGTRKHDQWAWKRSEGQVERIRKVIEKAEKAKSKIFQRKQEWDKLYKTKPSEDYEDPQDVLAIKNAKENMGDLKLKTAEDYTVPEHLRINAEQKRNELAMLESIIHEQKSAMNLSILELRDFKVETMEQMKSLVVELKVIQSMLDPSKHLPIPNVPSMHPDENPERKFQYDSETLQKFKQEQAKQAQAPRVAEGGGFGAFEGFGAQQQAAVKQAWSSRPSTTTTVRSYRDTSAGSQEDAELSELEKEMIRIEEIQNLYRQKNIIKQINDLVISFDAELRLLRHKKLQLDVQMKLADLRHITLFEELMLLKEYEKREDILQEKVSDRVSELEDMKRKSEDYLQQLETKRKDIVKLQEKEKTLHATFQTSLGEKNKFDTFLTKVFKKKIKRTKKKEVTGDEEEDEDSDEESDDESTYESDEEESDSEDGVFDDSVCPNNCDPQLFDNTLQLREKRLDIEEALAEEKKLVDNLKKENDALAKKVKIVEVNLKSVVAELEAFQREKQQKLNELHVVVPLKLHQVDYMINGEIPSDLSQALVFTNHSLESLQHRIKELHLEKVEKRELYKQAREQHKQLIRERREMEGKIEGLEEKCRQQMMMKFGRLVDLEALQTLSVNITLEELKMKSSQRRKEMDQEIAEWEVKIMEAKKKVVEVTRENTKKLDRLNEILTEKKVIEAKLDTRQAAVGAEFQGPRKADIRERQKLLHRAQVQAEEMENLKEEISLLSKKGGSILPPIRQ